MTGHGRLWSNRPLASVSVLSGMADFVQNRLWPNRTLAKPTLDLWCLCVCVWCVCVLCVCVDVGFTVSWCGVSCVGCWFQGFGLVVFGAKDRPSRGPPFPWTAQNFALFSLSHRKIRSFLPSLGVFSWNFGGVFEGRDRKMCPFGLSGCRATLGRRVFTQQPENSKRPHLSAPALQTPPKFHDKTNRDGRKERILRRESEKKREILGLPPFGPPLHLGWAPTLLAPTLRTPHPSVTLF